MHALVLTLAFCVIRESLATAKVEAAAAERKQHEYRQLLLEQDAEIHMLEQALRSQLARKHVTGEVGTQTEPKKRALKAPDADKPRKRTKKASSAFHQALAAPDTVAVASSAVASASCALEGPEQLTSPPPTTSGTPASLLTAATTEPNCLESTSSGQLVSVAAETFAVTMRAVALATCASEGQRPAASATPRAPTRLSLSATIVPARHESTPNDQSGHRSTNVWDASDEDFVELQSQAKKRRGPTPNKKV